MPIRKVLPSNNLKIADPSGFTLIELLVVIAIIAIISVVVILVLNPAELLRQSRDSNRISDMQTLTTAIGVYAAGGGTSFGNSNTVYVSIPDPTATSTAGDQCQGLGLPSLPSTYSYHCAATSTVRSTDSTGWIPVNFGTVAIGSSLSQLPIDPINQSSSRLYYYTYTTNGTQFEVTAVMESTKYKLGGSNDVVSTDGGPLASVYEKGSKLGLEPLDYGDSYLAGLWTMDEGTNTVAYDYSGNNATGSWSGTQTGSSGYYSAGKIGSWAGNFNGTNDFIQVPGNSFNSSQFSATAWIKVPSNPASANRYLNYGVSGLNDGGWLMGVNTNGTIRTFLDSGCNATWGNLNTSAIVTDGNWHFTVMTYDGTTRRIYVDSVLDNSNVYGYCSSPSLPVLKIGNNTVSSEYFTGLIDDVRLYSRVLSASEIAAMYAGGK